MSKWKGFAIIAGCAAMTCTSLVRATDSVQPAADSSFSLKTSPVYADAATPPTPLMGLLDKAGVGKSLEDAGINITGFVEASYTYSASSPPRNEIAGRLFDVDHEDITLNQLELDIQKTVDAAAAAKNNKWDWGFNIETIYGGDARFLHSNGMNMYGDGNPQASPDEQVDFLQAYVDLALPVGTGLKLRVGKFVALAGYEVINPTGNALYSHSFQFNYAVPATETGILATYALSDKLSVTAGITRGWNQSLKDNNGDAIDFVWSGTYAISDKTSLTIDGTIGPEAGNDPGNWWYLVDSYLTTKLSDQLSIGFGGDYGYYTHGSVGGSAAQWYGLAAYAGYTVNNYVTVNGRLEWYDDNDGFTVAGAPNVLYGATLGASVTPMPSNDWGKNLVIRPEVRFDYADQSFFDGGTDHYQFTAAVDAYYKF